ncbi:hypothetical protein RGQ15_20090 [Paracoccus sp. MBLB3053]|uniref:HEAT repeat domain-containing protein n=1 Tax=Paracoccus aurantius TaxID=3073814 RepID=A0ABU2HYP4_9RHOB|nr:DUF6880 family protein [Paracoccus sp. MBLB3053]MDS9469862.1 hypothetical protein [Paracoccus sp. MBLB3053]
MSKKTLNRDNLEKLGAERLAALVMDLVQGSAALQRRARMELSAAQGPKDVAADIRKRFASLRRSSSFVNWRGQKALVKDLHGLLAMIENTVAPHDANEAFELLWALLQLAPSIHARTDDSNGAIGDVLHEAVQVIARLSPKFTMSPDALAERILDAVSDAGHGEFDDIIPALAGNLGHSGLEHLKKITTAWQASPPTVSELQRFRGYGRATNPEESVRRSRAATASVILADIADAQGDVDAYMARYSAEQLTYGTIAPDVARRLLDAGRVDEAADIVSQARLADKGRNFRDELDEIHAECLEREGRGDELKAHLWRAFEEVLDGQSLRKYLKLLPDFDDIEAEEKALNLAEAHPDLAAALYFLIRWPAHDRAARLVLARADALDGDFYELLTSASEALEAHHPLAATLMRRAMIEDTLDRGKSKRYRYAARHLAECKSSEPAIEDYGRFATHPQFVDRLRQKHGRKYGFWQLIGA